jgi:hypothetical protein
MFTLTQNNGRNRVRPLYCIDVYVDGNEPMLAKTAVKREAGYRSLGYRAASSEELDLETSAGT